MLDSWNGFWFFSPSTHSFSDSFSHLFCSCNLLLMHSHTASCLPSHIHSLFVRSSIHISCCFLFSSVHVLIHSFMYCCLFFCRTFIHSLVMQFPVSPSTRSFVALSPFFHHAIIHWLSSSIQWVTCCSRSPTAQNGAPAKALLLLSTVFVVLMLPGRAFCAHEYEDIMGVLAILCTAPYFLFFCRSVPAFVSGIPWNGQSDTFCVCVFCLV